MRHEQFDSLPETLRALPRYASPPSLSGRLRILASRECLRRRRLINFETFWRHCRGEVSLFFNNLMKPFAVPFAGGLASAIILFAMLAPSFAIQRHIDGDVPTGLTTEASLYSSFSFNMSDVDIVVDVFIDEQGRVMDYSIPRGQTWGDDPALLLSIENTLLCTKFTPATLFGRPASGRTRITLRRSHLEVRG